MYKNSSPREEVLRQLQLAGSATVEELARRLTLVPVTVRSHLQALMEQGLVERAGERGHVGRPRHRYSLTQAGRERSGTRYAGLAADLLLGLQNLAGQRGVDQLLDLAAARYAQAQAPSAGSLAERVAHSAAVLDQEGSLAEVEHDDGAFTIHACGCPYLQLACQRDDICRYHTQVLTRLVGEPVRLTQAIAHGANRCTFRIGAAARGAVGVRTVSDGRQGPSGVPATGR